MYTFEKEQIFERNRPHNIQNQFWKNTERSTGVYILLYIKNIRETIHKSDANQHLY